MARVFYLQVNIMYLFVFADQSNKKVAERNYKKYFGHFDGRFLRYKAKNTKMYNVFEDGQIHELGKVFQVLGNRFETGFFLEVEDETTAEFLYQNRTEFFKENYDRYHRLALFKVYKDIDYTKLATFAMMEMLSKTDADEQQKKELVSRKSKAESLKLYADILQQRIYINDCDLEDSVKESVTNAITALTADCARIIADVESERQSRNGNKTELRQILKSFEVKFKSKK
jgi:hypothetical protein